MSILDNDRGSNQVNEKGQLKKGVNFGVIPMNDLDWILTQKPSVIQLFIECWRCDPYGSRWMQMNTKLKDRAFRDAKKKLSDQGLFVFKRETSIQDSRSTVCWMVKNLHGSRVKGYWEDCKAEVLGGTTTPDCGTTMPECSTSAPILGTAMPPISPQTQSEQGSQNRSISLQHHIHDQQHFNSAEDLLIVDEKAFENKEKENAINEIRRLGIERNEFVLALLKKHAANVPDAIAYIQQRQGEGETFGNITGAFVDALRKGKKPQHTEPSFGLHKDINPPTEQQLQALEDARGRSLILDYFFSSIDNTYKVILLDGITQVPWWQYLDI